MRSRITRVVCENIKFLRNYVCPCGFVEQGFTERAEFDGSPERLADFMVRLARNPNPHKMPVGWSSNLDGIFCPTCTEKRNAPFEERRDNAGTTSRL